jgi:hypothetical protein
MGRLVNPTLGDLFDRLLILGLKIEHCRDTDHFLAESVEIGSIIEGKLRQGIKEDEIKADDLVFLARLAAVNARLWYLEEEAKKFGYDPTPEQLAPRYAILTRIHHLNRQRAKIVDSFDPSRGPEKVAS